MDRWLYPPDRETAVCAPDGQGAWIVGRYNDAGAVIEISFETYIDVVRYAQRQHLILITTFSCMWDGRTGSVPPYEPARHAKVPTTSA